MGAIRVRLLLMSIMALVVPEACSELNGLRLELAHVDSNGNFSKLELLQRAALRSNHRMARLTAAASGNKVQAPVHAGNGEFLMDLAIGTPGLAFSAIIDTGSDLIWTQCKPCVECFSQPTPVFDPSTSSTFTKLPCSSNLCQALPTSICGFSGCEYLYSYGDSSSTQGVLAGETFTFGTANPTSVSNIAFGCGNTNQGSGFSQGSGLVGLGRGPLSLISQLGLGKFSYCLTSLDESKKSPLLFGSLADLSSTAVQSTPLRKNPTQPSFYYVSLEGITVGGTRLQIPSSTFALQEDGTGGLIIDSGTSITYLELAGYRQLKKAFLSEMRLPVADGSETGLDLCFSQPSGSSTVEVPKLTFHFDGADLDLPAKNFMIMDSTTGLLCLTIMASSGLSILGNFQQQNLQILYDLKNEALSFVPTHSAQLRDGLQRELIEMESKKCKLTRTQSSLLRSPIARSSIQSIFSVTEANDDEEKPQRPRRRRNRHRQHLLLLLPLLVFLLFFYLRQDSPVFANLVLFAALILLASVAARRSRVFVTRRASSVDWSIGDDGGRGRHQSEKKEKSNGRAVCEGVEVYSNGDSYEGEFHLGRCSGSGVYRFFAAKGRYEGDWVDNKYDGHGIETWARGSRYRGQYRHGLRHGFGVYRFYSGDSYAGEWAGGQSHGVGVQTCSDGSRYAGEFKTGVKHGLGCYHFRNGDQYSGEYFGDKIHGFGVYRFANGHCYEGSWHEGKKQGFGLYTFRSGETRSGDWGCGVLNNSLLPSDPAVQGAVQVCVLSLSPTFAVF
ncbi:hypothetical protein BHM03_00033691 [Ensete ventricosum]|nr:hypothetical protein BHM03_00033691 [Ensete ventricosum]